MGPDAELFHGVLNAEYYQFYLLGDSEEVLDVDDAFRGQDNGMLGAGSPVGLFFMTGTRGDVDVRIALHAQEPVIDDTWEEVVEASYAVSSDLLVVEWEGDTRARLSLPPGSYRVRYQARGMGTRDAGAGPPGTANEQYEVSLWQAPAGPDRVVRQTGGQAASLHAAVRGEDRPQPPVSEKAARAEQAVQRITQQIRTGQGAPDAHDHAGTAEASATIAATAARVYRKLVPIYGWLGDMCMPANKNQVGDTFVVVYFIGLDMGGTYLELDPRRRRVKLEWTIAPTPVPRSSVDLGPRTYRSTVTLDATATGRTSNVTIVHTGLPAAWSSDMQLLWEAHLERLQRHFTGAGDTT